jgi:pyridoxamine 5'-phosphate oxidase
MANQRGAADMIDPLSLLADDRKRARAANDPWANLCALATVDAIGEPQARVLVLRDLDARLALFFNGTSPKHAEVQLAVRHAVLVFLASQAVQYRMSVVLEPLPPVIVRRAWLDRPRIPKVMDWLYERHQPQSSVAPSRDHLDQRFAELHAELPATVEAPPNAVGYYINVERLERLELANDRVHTRQRFERNGDEWIASELIP